jgi:SAM-dependent methyltransferase
VNRQAPDWGAGRYEVTAEQLLPAARAIVDRAAPAEGERVVDVGTGTGNAALLAAERGARVIGVDPAPRLLAVARERAAAAGLDAEFALGDGANLPLPDGEADLTLSVFGVIFAGDPAAAAAEMARVTAPGGRIVIGAWIPEGAIRASITVARDAVLHALGAPPAPPQFAWHDSDALLALFGPVGFGRVQIVEDRLAFTAASAAAHVDGDAENHPLSVVGRALLERRGEYQAVRDRMVAILDAANEDPGSFRITSRYVIATLTVA